MRTFPRLYERLTWPEVRDAAAEDLVCLIPVATLEDHGPLLPIDTDLRLTTEICRRAAEAAPEAILLLPPIPHGYSPHHMAFPGPITIAWDTFTRYLVHIGSLVAAHQYKPVVFSHMDAIDADAVDMEKAVDERSYPAGQHSWMDWADGPLKIMPWWSSFSRTGVQGDATKATAEKGARLLDAAVRECVEFVRELLAKPLPSRREPRETVS